MKAKMTVYQNGGKMTADDKKQELARKLFGSIPKFNKEEARRGMMAEKINKLQKEYDYWTKKGEPTTASGVKVQMDKIREDMKKYTGGGKVDIRQRRQGRRQSQKTWNRVVRDEGRERKKERQLTYLIKGAPVMGGGKMDMMYGMGGKMKKYLMGGQVKLDKNKDGKISAVDFKMLKKK
jgi:hypothetical protein